MPTSARRAACGLSRRLRSPAAAQASSRRGAAAAADRDGRQADQAHHHRPGRICRPLRRGRLGRGARARLRLSRQGAFQRRPDRQAGRSPVHHRQAAVPEHARPGARQPRAGEGQPRLHRGRSRARQAARARRTITEQIFEQRTQAKRNAAAVGRGHEAAVRQAELDLEFTELRAPVAGPHRRPARLAGQSRHRRQPAATPRCSPPSSRSIRSASSSPSMRRRTCATSGSRTAARTAAEQTSVDRSRSS